MHTSSSVRTQQLQLTDSQPSLGECWIPPKKDMPGPTARKSPNKKVGGAKLHLESNPIPARDTWRAQTKPCVHKDPETPQRFSQTRL